MARQVLRGFIVAAVALVALVLFGSLTYDDSLDRSRVAEAMVVAEACRQSVGAFVEARKAFPSTTREAGCSEDATRFADPVRISGTRIELTLRHVNRTVDGSVVVLEPTGGVEGTTRLSSQGRGGGWRCATTAAPQAYKQFPTYCRQAPLAR